MTSLDFESQAVGKHELFDHSLFESQ